MCLTVPIYVMVEQLTHRYFLHIVIIHLIHAHTFYGSFLSHRPATPHPGPSLLISDTLVLLAECLRWDLCTPGNSFNVRAPSIRRSTTSVSFLMAYSHMALLQVRLRNEQCLLITTLQTRLVFAVHCVVKILDPKHNAKVYVSPSSFPGNYVLHNVHFSAWFNLGHSRWK